MAGTDALNATSYSGKLQLNAKPSTPSLALRPTVQHGPASSLPLIEQDPFRPAERSGLGAANPADPGASSQPSPFWSMYWPVAVPVVTANVASYSQPRKSPSAGL